jgi:hypothetical protein
MNKKQKEAIARGLQVVDIRPNNEDKFRRPTLEGGFGIFSRAGGPPPPDTSQSEVVRSDQQGTPQNEGQGEDEHTSDGQREVHLSDRQRLPTVREKNLPLTLAGKNEVSFPPTVGNKLPPTPFPDSDHLLTPDSQSQVDLPPTFSIPLSPVQWQVLQVLQELEASSEICSYRDIAARIKGKREGVKSAVQVLHKVGAFLAFSIVRNAKTQGIEFRLDPAKQFHQTSLRKSKGLPKRGSNFPLTVGGRREVSTRMYVSSSFYKNTYIRDLLKLFPAGWQIREQTLQQVWKESPNMSSLEFRRSLLHLIEQTKTGPEVKNPNAWIKGAFERNGGPIVTESMIEAQLERRSAPLPKFIDLEKDRRIEEGEVLHAYLAADTEEKVQIDRMAEERIERLLKTISSEKHAGIREQARLECAKEFFAAKAEQS